MTKHVVHGVVGDAAGTGGGQRAGTANADVPLARVLVGLAQGELGVVVPGKVVSAVATEDPATAAAVVLPADQHVELQIAVLSNGKK